MDANRVIIESLQEEKDKKAYTSIKVCRLCQRVI